VVGHGRGDSARHAPRNRVCARLFLVHFAREHEFDAARAAVAGILCDPDFHRNLDLPDLSLPEVLEASVDGPVHTVVLRYQYVGQLDPIARRVVGGRDLTWRQELRVDTTTYEGTLTFSAEAAADRLNGSATIALDAVDDTHTRRRIAGDLHVRIPLVGGTAEKRIVPGLVRRLDVEAAAAAAKLASRS